MNAPYKAHQSPHDHAPQEIHMNHVARLADLFRFRPRGKSRRNQMADPQPANEDVTDPVCHLADATAEPLTSLNVMRLSQDHPHWVRNFKELQKRDLEERP